MQPNPQKLELTFAPNGQPGHGTVSGTYAGVILPERLLELGSSWWWPWP